jgi:hypothetical protein
MIRNLTRQTIVVVAFVLSLAMSHVVLAQSGESRLTVQYFAPRIDGFSNTKCYVSLNSEDLGYLDENSTRTFECSLMKTGNVLTLCAGSDKLSKVFDATEGSKVSVTFGNQDLGWETFKCNYFPYRDFRKKYQFAESVDIVVAKPSKIVLSIPPYANVVYGRFLNLNSSEAKDNENEYIFETTNLLPTELAYVRFTIQRKKEDGTVSGEEEFHVPVCGDRKYEYDLSDFGDKLSTASRTSFYLNAVADILSKVDLDGSPRNLGHAWKWVNEVLSTIKVSGVDSDATILINKISNFCVSGCELVRRIEPKEDPYIADKVAIAQATGGASALLMFTGEVLLEVWGSTSEQKKEIESFLERYRDLQKQSLQTQDVLAKRHNLKFSDSSKLISNVTLRTTP